MKGEEWTDQVDIGAGQKGLVDAGARECLVWEGVGWGDIVWGVVGAKVGRDDVSGLLCKSTNFFLLQL